MKFRCERDVLVEALTNASRAVSTRATGMPVLAGLLFELNDQELTITGTDLDLTLQVTLLVAGLENGSAVIPARLITDIVKAVLPGSVVVEAEENEARLSAARSQFAVRTLDHSEFPSVIKQEGFTAVLPAADLSEALRQVVRAASGDDARPVLTGVHLSAEDTGLRLVATDSYRLAVRDLPGARILQADQSVLVPSKALGELARLLTGGEEEVQVALDEKEIRFSLGNVHLTSRLIEGQFPDYRPLIPASYPNRLRIDRDTLLESVRRVKLLVRDSTTPVRLSLRVDGVELKVVNQETGQASEDIEAKYEGEEITVAFNPTFLIDGLEAIPAGDVVIETIDALKPATLKADEHDEFLYLIMPVRVA